MNKKWKLILLIVMIFLMILGTSFAFWQLTINQTDKNVVNVACFKITLEEENSINLEKSYPITDEEGKKLTPYTFTITNTCESFASFQINLEILDTTSFENLDYMKVMLEDKISILTSNQETTKTLENATKSFKLQTGYLRENQSKTFHLRIWMDENTPTNKEFMNKSLESKIVIVANYKENLDNNIVAEGTYLNEKYQSTETFSLHVTSENYNLVAISEDLENWEELELKGRDITIEKTVTENGTYTYYFKDEAENVKEVSVTATKIDDKKPIANMNVTKTNNVISIDASTSKDNETSISKYYYSKDGINYEESESSTYQFTNEYEYGIATTMLTNYERNQIKKIYLKTEDEVGNLSDVKEININETDFVYDGTTDNNLRYIGSNPNNYVSFNNELWRIIGVMNNIDDGTGKIETRIKLIRNESIGEYSWDTSTSEVNGGNGVNEWSQADLMKLLNPGYENESIGGSLYWNRQSGNCYNGENNTSFSCDFTHTGLMSNEKLMLDRAVWNLGSNGSEVEFNNILTTKFYELERSSNTGKICASGSYCNDKEIRNATWTGYIGLMYPSDYGFATSGGTTTDRASCLNTVLYNWNNSELSDCKTNDWLFKSGIWQWTISPNSRSDNANIVFILYGAGTLGGQQASHASDLLLTLYLKANIKIISGNGSTASPFQLSLE